MDMLNHTDQPISHPLLGHCYLGKSFVGEGVRLVTSCLCSVSGSCMLVNKAQKTCL